MVITDPWATVPVTDKPPLEELEFPPLLLEEEEDEDDDDFEEEEGEGAAGNVEHDHEWEKKMAEHIRNKANGGQGATNEVTTTTDTPVDQQ